LTKKDAFVWGEGAQEAFKNLKKVMRSYPCLAIPNFLVPFTIECDASKLSVGAILIQKG